MECESEIRRTFLGNDQPSGAAPWIWRDNRFLGEGNSSWQLRDQAGLQPTRSLERNFRDRLRSSLLRFVGAAQSSSMAFDDCVHRAVCCLADAGRARAQNQR